MKKRALVGAALLAVAVLARAARRRSRRTPWGQRWGSYDGLPLRNVELEAAPVVKVRGAMSDVAVVRGTGERVVIGGSGVSGAQPVSARRVEDDAGPAVVVDVQPRQRVEIQVPMGTAVRLAFSKSRVRVAGVDDVDVRCAKSQVTLQDVGGSVRVRGAKDSVEIALSGDRPTRTVDVAVAKCHLALDVPASRGGSYDVTAAKCVVTVPTSVDGGVPVRLRGAKSNLVVRAA